MPTLPGGAQADPHVEVSQGLLRGTELGETGGAFLGVPFAAAPMGERRWRYPAPQEPWEGTRDAVAFAPACMQGSYMTDWYADVIGDFGGEPETAAKPVSESEDCLYLNVWSPDLQPDTPLPVMVWIHGGGYSGGWTYEPNYIGDALSERGVIVVSIAYRLGPFGYLGPDSTGNFGLMDQVMALEWVQENIGSFGGDANNVTLFGESAGAASIGTLIVTPKAAGLFQKAIHQSGGFEFIEASTHRDIRPAFEILTAALAPLDPATVSASDLLETSQSVLSDHWFTPVADGALLPDRPDNLLARREVNAVDLMIGTNSDEWLMSLDMSNLEEQIANWGDRAPGATEMISALVQEAGIAGALDRLETAHQMRCPGARLAAAMNAAGKQVYMYRFSRVRASEMGARIGSYHGAEIPYVFNTHDDWLPTDAVDTKLTDLMMQAWVEFARSGDPARSLDWPEYGSSGSLIELGDQITVSKPLDRALCDHLGRIEAE
ncbi:MAG: carboxylesterase/lipase family protein [Henriciella sp.]